MKTLIVGLILLISTTTVIAQKTEFGVKLGYNAANFTNDQGSDYKMISSFHLGALAHIHINKSWAVQPELMYSGQGTKFVNSNSDNRYCLGYINLPVLGQFMTANGFRFETGPQIGFLVSASEKSGDVSKNIKDIFNGTDFAWAFGVGYITPSKFGFDIRYNLGLTDVAKASSVNVRNSVVQAGVFYQFD